MSKARTRTAAVAAIFVALLTAGAARAQVDLSRALADPGLNPARTSIVVADASTGKVLAAHMPDLALNPASCAKLATSLAALEVLGPGHKFRTVFASDGPPRHGRIGTLYVRGDGDPSLINEELAALGSRLYAHGIRAIDGGIVIDNGYFDSFYFPRKGGNDGRAYTAKISAVAVNFNSIGVKVAPGRPGGQAVASLDPPLAEFRLINKVRTGGKTNIHISGAGGGDGRTITVSGTISPRAGEGTFWRSVDDPVAYAGAVIAHQFRAQGIEVAGPVRYGTMPPNAHFIAEQFSRPLSEIVYDMNKLSTNFVAEQITKHLGAARFGPPGSTEKGVAAIEEHLASIGVPRGSATLENGSGLSAMSRISSSQLVRILVSAYRDP
ncbi:MAG: D-alanyl-D-alanine carboxypeptidase/D-alanyl-D-alanine-endopeptidase, partial [Proteobacteria bacterium]|nr:D-alanyl-D-alanine carboxypeptidase/D-alanyl-D-alanine-endopeptidase [Pseudomonadota bacterium]